MIRINKKQDERTGAIAISSTKENHRDGKDGKNTDSTKILQTKSSAGFSLFGRKSSIEEIKKKSDPSASGPISADSKQLEDAKQNVLERYAVREPVLYIS